MKTVVLVICSVVAATNCYSNDVIELKLHTGKNTYRIGEKITFEFVFRNRSDKAVRLFPDPEIYSPRAISVSKVDGGGNVEEIEIGESSMDWRDWSKNAVSLSPGRVHTWRLKAGFKRHLPPEWKPYLLPEWKEDKPAMPYLVFVGGSALRLPGFGKYSVVAKYEFGTNHPVVEYVKGEPKLWFGKLRSEPITIQLKE